jgi:imidazolonepropionase-like amidohydrolase
MQKHLPSLFLTLLCLNATARAETFAVRAGLIYTAAGEPIADGMLVVKDGKIAAIGSSGRTSVPGKAKVFDYPEAVIIPGLIDLHSHIGVYAYPQVEAQSDGNEMTDPFTPEVRAIDSFRLDDPAIRDAVSGGVTTVLSRPGSGNVVGGLGVLVKLIPDAASVEEMVLRDPADMKMATEWNPILTYGGRGQRPATRMDVFAMLRQELRDAQSYIERMDEYKRDKDKNPALEPPARDLKMEAMAMLLRREIPVHIHTSRADEIIHAVRICEEFNLDCNLGHAEWGFKVARLLAQKGIVSVVGPRMFRPDPDTDRTVCIPCVMAEAGAPMAFQTDHPVVKQEYLLYQATLAVRYGTPEDVALRAVTSVPARTVHVEERIGSLEAGKDADFAVLDGPPFEAATRVLVTYINGRKIYERQ